MYSTVLRIIKGFMSLHVSDEIFNSEILNNPI